MTKLPKYLIEKKTTKPKTSKFTTKTSVKNKSVIEEMRKKLTRKMAKRATTNRKLMPEKTEDEEMSENSGSAEDERDMSEEDLFSKEEIPKKTSLEKKRKGSIRGDDKNNENEEKKSQKQNGKCVYWNEYWDEQEQRWITVDPFFIVVDVPAKIETNFGDKMLYVLAIDNDFGVREVAGKYIDSFLTQETRKLRTDCSWLQQTLDYQYLRITNSTRQEAEEAAILELLKAQPFPRKLAEYKNHPLYALKRDLLKFEAIYPADQGPLGTVAVGRVGSHDIFPRSSVHKLEGSLNWIKESRSIKAGEKPYKIVKARPKTNIPKEKRTPLTLDLYGFWQTEPYVPPEVTNGKIPRNEFGNIYMYKEEMLPNECVHLRLNGIYNLARRLDLEAVPAVVGWEFSGGQNHPTLDGCVVLKKDAEALHSTWLKMAQNRASNEAKKNNDRIWKNWRRLVRSKLLLEKMRDRFK